MCPYCQKTFKTAVNCKKHMKTHRQELALQRQAGGQAVLMGNMVDGSMQQMVPMLTTTTGDNNIGTVDGLVGSRSTNLMQEIELVEVSHVTDSEMQLNPLSMSMDEHARQLAALMQLQGHEQEHGDLENELVTAQLLTADNAVNIAGTVVTDLPGLVSDIQLHNALSQQVCLCVFSS